VCVCVCVCEREATACVPSNQLSTLAN